MKELTFDTALSEATARESAVKNAASSMSTLEIKQPKKEVLLMKNAEKSKGQSRKNGQKRASYNMVGRQTHMQQAQQQANSQSEKRHAVVVCYCCGKPNHIKTECRFKDYTCNYCHERASAASM